jgi:hypothetical protein
MTRACFIRLSLVLCPLLGGALLTVLPLNAQLPNGQVPVGEPQPQADESEKEPAPLITRPGDVEAHFTDGSKMKLNLRDTQIRLKTPYGRLLIPITDIQHIEVATRIPPEAARQIKEAIANLGSSEFRTRQQASNTLLSHGIRAYPALVRATKSSDAEVRSRAERLVEKIRAHIPEEHLVERKSDVVHTADSKIAGQIEEEVLQAQSSQFGKVEMKLADLRLLHTGNAREEDEGPVAGDPGNLLNFHNQIGKSFRFRVTGNINGFVYGTDVYTTDSTLATVAVHAGILNQGQTKVIKVTMVASPNAFQASTRNGVTSWAWGPYPVAFKVSR